VSPITTAPHLRALCFLVGRAADIIRVPKGKWRTTGCIWYTLLIPVAHSPNPFLMLWKCWTHFRQVSFSMSPKRIQDTEPLALTSNRTGFSIRCYSSHFKLPRPHHPTFTYPRNLLRLRPLRRSLPRLLTPPLTMARPEEVQIVQSAQSSELGCSRRKHVPSSLHQWRSSLGYLD
jgi:hypothetical protein